MPFHHAIGTRRQDATTTLLHYTKLFFLFIIPSRSNVVVAVVKVLLCEKINDKVDGRKTEYEKKKKIRRWIATAFLSLSLFPLYAQRVLIFCLILLSSCSPSHLAIIFQPKRQEKTHIFFFSTFKLKAHNFIILSSVSSSMSLIPSSN